MEIQYCNYEVVVLQRCNIMSKLFSKTIKTIAKIGVKNAILDFFQKNANTYNNKSVCVIPDVPLTSDINKHIKFYTPYDTIPSMTIVRVENHTPEDITYDIYKLVYDSKKALAFYTIHNAIYDFYEWYIKFLIDPKSVGVDDFDDTLLSLEPSKIKDLIKECSFSDIADLLFISLFDIDDVSTNNKTSNLTISDVISKINLFKLFMKDYRRFRKLALLQVLK